jgi:hypothetical protein
VDGRIGVEHIIVLQASASENLEREKLTAESGYAMKICRGLSIAPGHNPIPGVVLV